MECVRREEHWLTLDISPMLIVDICPLPAKATVKQTYKYPAIFGRVPLFLPNRRRREFEEPETLKSSKWGTVTFKSMSLKTSDEEVFIEIINNADLMDNKKTYQYMKTIKHLCKTLKRDRQDIAESVKALTGAGIVIEIPYVNLKHDGTLLEWVEYDEVSDMLTVNFPKAYRDEKAQVQILDMGIYNELSLMGKSLYRLISCNINEGYVLKTIKDAVAPHHVDKKLVHEMKKQLDKLKMLRVLKSYCYNKSTKKLTVEKYA